MTDSSGVFRTVFQSSATIASLDSEILTNSLHDIINAFKDHTTELLGLVAYSGFDVQKFRAALVHDKKVTNEECGTGNARSSPIRVHQKADGCSEYPAIARQSSLACFLPQKVQDSEAMLAVFFLPNLMLSETINRGKKDWKALNENEKAETTHVYQLNAWNSTLFSEEERISWSLKLGILVKSSKGAPEYSSIWREARKAAEKLLQDKHAFSFNKD
ncbi:hypothetical protein JYU34_010377 [Plutella xylostella]|uniref:Uncharacterized protein n=1 Tax=Plutella xylostella TaxID=51655 RepID=A0ABQ7QIA6_PLUXY|nr:hypothetical protein JYU34_010377 [Plutella xylostella]